MPDLSTVSWASFVQQNPDLNAVTPEDLFLAGRASVEPAADAETVAELRHQLAAHHLYRVEHDAVVRAAALRGFAELLNSFVLDVDTVDTVLIQILTLARNGTIAARSALTADGPTLLRATGHDQAVITATLNEFADSLMYRHILKIRESTPELIIAQVARLALADSVRA